MPVVNYERGDGSRGFDLNGQGASLVLHWFVGGTMNETEVYLTALLATPTIYDNLVRDGIKADDQGGGNWYVDIAYKDIALQQGLPNDGGPGGGGTTPQPTPPGSDSEFLGPNYSFDTTGGTEHIVISNRTMEKKSASGHQSTDKTRQQAQDAGWMLDNKRVINATPDGVAGVDRYAPVFNWSCSWTKNNIDKAYLRTIRNMTAKVNDAPFYRWQAGEVLFLGASSPGRRNGRWDITYRFSVNENRTSVEIGNGIVLEKVLGWEEICVEYHRDPTTFLNVPKSARVEEKYAPRNFALLEIGT